MGQLFGNLYIYACNIQLKYQSHPQSKVLLFPHLSKWRRNWISIAATTWCRIPRGFVHLVVLFISIKGRINFLQLARFSDRCESRFRYFFERGFDFLTFNKSLIQMNIKGKAAPAFDPSYIYSFFSIFFKCIRECLAVPRPERRLRVQVTFDLALQEEPNGDQNLAVWQFQILPVKSISSIRFSNN